MPLSKVALRRLERAEAIRAQSARDAGTVGVCPSLFVQAMLPHSAVLAPGPGPQAFAHVFSATNGDFTLSLRAGTDRYGRSVGVPYGGRARLLLAHLCTRARMRYGRLARRAPARGAAPDPAALEAARQVDLGPTLAAFMRELEITPTGGAHGSIRSLTDQLHRLATCVVTFEWDRHTPLTHAHRRDLRGEVLPLAQRYHFWWLSPLLDPDGLPIPSAHPGPAAGGTLTLSEPFMRELVLRAVPVDLRKLQYLRAHPLAADLYLWTTYGAQRLAAHGRSHKAVAWRDLHAQLGGHYGDGPRGLKDFAYRARAALAKVRSVWPELDVTTPRGRLVLHSTEPDVHPLDSP